MQLVPLHVGWRIYRENLQIHQKVDEAEREAAEEEVMMRTMNASEDEGDHRGGGDEHGQYDAAGNCPTGYQTQTPLAAYHPTHADKLRKAGLYKLNPVYP
jgi:hypothetical protein